MTPLPDEIDRAVFRFSFVRWRCHRIHCDIRTYYKELTDPGSVRGLVGLRIRFDVDEMRRVHGRNFLARADARRAMAASRERY